MNKTISFILIFFFLSINPILVKPVKGGGSNSHPPEGKEMKEMGGMKHAMMMEVGEEQVVPCMGKKLPVNSPDYNKGKIIIKSPKEGDVIRSELATVKVEFEILDKGNEGEHAHIYVNGDCKAMVSSGKSNHFVSGLKNGDYAIGVRLVSIFHEETGAQDWVIIKVKGQK